MSVAAVTVTLVCLVPVAAATAAVVVRRLMVVVVVVEAASPRDLDVFEVLVAEERRGICGEAF